MNFSKLKALVMSYVKEKSSVEFKFMYSKYFLLLLIYVFFQNTNQMIQILNTIDSYQISLVLQLAINNEF